MLRISGLTMVVTLAVATLAVPTPRADAAIVICQHGKSVKLRADACKKKEQQVTLGTDSVPSAVSAQNAQTAQTAQTADNANKLGGLDPSAFEPALVHVPLTLIDPGNEAIVGQVGPFEIILTCNWSNVAGDAALGIRNVGESHAVAHSSDDDDDDFNPGDTIYFDIDDAGDAGFAVAPSGWAVQVGGLGGTANAAARTSIANNKCIEWTTYFTIAHP